MKYAQIIQQNVRYLLMNARIMWNAIIMWNAMNAIRNDVGVIRCWCDKNYARVIGDIFLAVGIILIGVDIICVIVIGDVILFSDVKCV